MKKLWFPVAVGLFLIALVTMFAMVIPGVAHAETRRIGDVSYKFNLVGPNDKIVVHAVDDPKIDGIVCVWSTAQTGGITGAVGLATDPNEASLACRQVGEIRFKAKFAKEENITKESRNWTSFRTMQVVRMCDEKTNMLIYLVYSDEIINGFPKNAISAVPIQPWGNGSAKVASCKDYLK